MKRAVAGFTLLEMMITLVIIGILAAIAIQNYTPQVRKARRTDAMGALTTCANGMERFYTQNYTYIGAGSVNNTAGDANGAGAPTVCPAATDYYTIIIKMDSTVTTYTLRATPIAGTTSSTDGIIELSSTGARSWDEDNNGLMDVGAGPPPYNNLNWVSE